MVNRKLKRRSRRLKKALDILELRNKGMIADIIQFMKDLYFEDDITMLFGQVIETL